MIDLPGYEIEKELHAGSKFTVYKGRQTKDNLSVVIKGFTSEYPNAHDIARIKQESEFSNLIDFDGVIRTLALEHHKNNYYLIMEEIGGVSLKDHLNKTPLPSRDFLTMAVSLAETLSKVHEKNVIHKDIKPSNIIYNKNTGQIKLTDFGIATLLTRETTSYSATNALEGTLSYISPEQTGRMNRNVDLRSDLYSLGVTFYEMLAGSLPFKEGKKSMELVHCHLAIEPEQLDVRNPGVPGPLADIVHKLLEKNAEDRYQSSTGLKVDLENCLSQLESGPSIQEFELGTKDVSGQFQILQKLYGRAKETKVLLSAFDRITQGSAELLTVAGFSGVGKTALVNETHKPITAKNGIFVSGKFDQFQRDVPYFAVGQAFDSFCNYLLQEPEDVLSEWKAKIKKAVGDQGQVLLDIFPNLELLIGKQPGVPDMLPAEAANRLTHTFQDFIVAICTKEHPLVLFIDDLQWVDAGSLSLLEHIMTNSESRYLLLICAFRDNEVDENHAFVLAVRDIQNQKVAVSHIKLKPLREKDVIHLISDSLQTTEEYAEPLSELTYQKTGGNAFFVNQFLKALAGDGLLSFSYTERKWLWDIDKIEARNVTDNVVELMSQKISRLSRETMEVLQLGACMGNQFDLKLINYICDDEPGTVLRQLWPAVNNGLIIPLDHNYKLLGSLVNETSSGEANLEQVSSQFKFIHDRVQEAAYKTIKDGGAAEIHLKIGRLLLSHTEQNELEERSFDILNQFEKGIELVQEAEEKERVMELCVIASTRALKSSAFDSSMNFAGIGTKYLLNEKSWEQNYQQTMTLYLNKSWSEYTVGEFEKSEKSVHTALEKCKNEDDMVELYVILSQLYFTMNRHHDGIASTRKCLKQLGVNTPNKVYKAHIAWQYLLMRLKMGFRTPENLMDLPAIKSRRHYNICRLLTNHTESTYIVEPNRMGYVSVLMMRICLKYGASEYTPFAMGITQCVMAGVTKELRYANRFGNVAIEMNEKYPDTNVKGRVLMTKSSFCHHWTNPVDEYIPLLRVSQQCSLDVGNLPWLNYVNLFSRFQSIFYIDRGLEEIIKDQLRAYQVFENAGDREVILSQVNILNFLYWLMDDETRVRNETFNISPEDYEEEMKTTSSNISLIYCFTLKAMKEYALENYEESFSSIRRSMSLVLELLGVIAEVNVRFYYNLSRLRVHKTLSFKDRVLTWVPYQLNRLILRYFKKVTPANYAPYSLMLDAEEAYFQGKYREPADLYDEAIEAANSADAPLSVALANELAGKFYLAHGKTQIAAAYLMEAQYNYENWGATAKVKQLKETYGHVLRRARAGSRTATTTQTSTSSTFSASTSITATEGATMGRGASSLDLGTIIRVTQAISGEIRLENLLKYLMKNLMENAGAAQGALALNRDGVFRVEATGKMKGQEAELEVLQAIEIDQYEDIPISVMNFVARTKESVVFSDAGAEVNQFENDHYIKTSKPRSLLCTPVINKGQLVGMLYLENRRTRGAFTHDRLTILNLISSQAAISLDNALLYTTLESRVEERTREIHDILTNVKQGILTINREANLTGGYSGQIPRIFENVQFARATALPISELADHPSLGEYIEMIFDSPFINQKMIDNANPLKEFDYIYTDVDKNESSKKLTFNFSRIFEVGSDGKETKTIGKVMVVIEDKTSEFALKEELEKKAEQESRKVEKLYSILQLDPNVFSGFISESSESIDLTAANLNKLGEDLEHNKELLRVAYREVHTVKGNARALNLDSIGKTAHELEDVFEEVKENPAGVNAELKEKVMAALDSLKSEVQDGGALFEKVLNIQNAFQDKPQDVMQEFEKRFRNIVEMEAESSAKQVLFVFRNELEKPLESAVIAKLKNPLSHIIRNSVTHGIESPELRIAAGKAERGTVQLRLVRVKEKIMIICEDDGAGLNTVKIREKALELKLFPEQEIKAMSDNEINRLIFHSGLSTNDEVTDSSGRGVGMDVVREDLKALKAAIGIRSRPGKSTRFSIQIPVG